MYYHHVLRCTQADFPLAVRSQYAKNRATPDVTSTASAPVETWICEERSRAAHRILVNRYAFKILPALRFHLFITVMTDEML